MGELKTVLCWCCEYHINYYYDVTNRERITGGKCNLHNRECCGENEVCEDFLLMSGLFTKRVIPDYCKNYKDRPIKREKISIDYYNGYRKSK